MRCHSVFVPLSAVVHPTAAETTNSHHGKRLGDRATLWKGIGVSFICHNVEALYYILEMLHVKLDRQRTDRTIAKRQTKIPSWTAVRPSPQ